MFSVCLHFSLLLILKRLSYGNTPTHPLRSSKNLSSTDNLNTFFQKFNSDTPKKKCLVNSISNTFTPLSNPYTQPFELNIQICLFLTTHSLILVWSQFSPWFGFFITLQVTPGHNLAVIHCRQIPEVKIPFHAPFFLSLHFPSLPVTPQPKPLFRLPSHIFLSLPLFPPFEPSTGSSLLLPTQPQHCNLPLTMGCLSRKVIWFFGAILFLEDPAMLGWMRV